MFAQLKGYFLIAVIVALVASHAGLYGLGRLHESQAEDKKELKEGFDSLTKAIDTSVKVQEGMIKVSQELVDKTEALRNNTIVIREAQKANARANPLPSSCTVDGRTVELRNQQIDQIRRALGLELPVERQAVVPAG